MLNSDGYLEDLTEKYNEELEEKNGRIHTMTLELTQREIYL